MEHLAKARNSPILFNNSLAFLFLFHSSKLWFSDFKEGRLFKRSICVHHFLFYARTNMLRITLRKLFLLQFSRKEGAVKPEKNHKHGSFFSEFRAQPYFDFLKLSFTSNLKLNNLFMSLIDLCLLLICDNYFFSLHISFKNFFNIFLLWYI